MINPILSKWLDKSINYFHNICFFWDRCFIFQILLLIYLLKKFDLIRIDLVQIRAPLVCNRTIPVPRSMGKGTKSVPFGTTIFKIQTTSVLMMDVFHLDLSKQDLLEAESRKPSEITNIIIIKIILNWLIKLVKNFIRLE